MRYAFAIFLLFCGALMALAHGDKKHDEDEDNIAEVAAADAPENPTYHEHVRPILEASCVGCHSDGQIAGFAPLTGAELALEAAEDIAWHVVNRYMPPWMPSDQNVPLRNDRRLSLTEIATVAAWAEAGAALGDESDYSTPEMTQTMVDVRADLTLGLDEGYTPDPALMDDYRCFAFELGLDAPRFVTGYEIVPGVAEMAHHGLAYLVNADVRAQIQAKESAEAGAGWSCYGGTGIDDQGGMLATWTPGTFGVSFPAGTGFRIRPGQIVVLQMHYNLRASRQPDRTRILLQLADEDADLAELRTLPLRAPVEIPCPPGLEGPQCQRDSALERLAELYGERFRDLPDRLLRLCDQTLEDYAENSGALARGSCDFDSPFPFKLRVYGALGHMHELGTSFRMTLNPEGEDPVIMLDIPRWDFHWQDRYQFVEPLEVKPGDALRMECAWDNRLSDEARYVVWGEGTSDEMCFATVLVALGM